MRKTTLTTIFACLFLAASVFAAKPSSNLTAEQALQKADKQFFIENKGQWHSDVLYLTRMGGLDVWITKYGVNYTFYKMEKKHNAKQAEHLPSKFDNDMKDATLLGHRVLLKLQNHQPNPKAEGKLKQAGYYNYLIGNDPSKHASYVGLYKEAVVKNVYNGIDLRYYFDKGYLRYDFVVQPGANPAQIHFTLKGENKEYLKNGALCYTTRFGEVQMQDLYVYQQGDKKQIQAKFTQQNGVWQFQLSNYDKTQPLIIDPLIYSTYIGGSDDDEGYSIAIDGSGNAYITGYTNSTNYDTTLGAFQTTYGGGVIHGDVFVTKLNSTGTNLLYSTYIGGSYDEKGYSIAIDGSGNAYITGYTESFNYAITAGAFQTTLEGPDVFVTKLNSTGTALIYSTYIGGDSFDGGYSIAIDGSGNAYITGYTKSTNYDITPGAFQTTFGGGFAFGDVFVTQLNSTGTALIYSTYIGGSDDDFGNAITIDNSGNAYITGRTNSNNYDITPGAFQTTNDGSSDVFVTKLNSTGTALIYSTYIGGSGYEEGSSIAIDGSGNAYITGYTGSTDYDITPGAFQTINVGGSSEIIVTKLNSTGTALLYSTYIGGIFIDVGSAIAVDGSGNAYITGYTISYDYDITADAFQTTNAEEGWDVVVTILNSTGTALIFSTYIDIGGGSYDEALSIAIDASGNAYITGLTSASTDNDITSGAFQTYNGGDLNVFVTKINLVGGLPPQPGPISGNINVCAGSTQTYSVSPVSGATSYTWTLPSGWTGNSTTESITVTVGPNGGNISITANNGGGSSIAQTLSITVTPIPSQPGAISGNASVCVGTTQTYSVSPVSGATSYTWTLPGGWTGTSTTNSINATAGAIGGIITVTANNACGSSTAQNLLVIVNPSPSAPTISASGPTSFCTGGSVTLTSSSASGNLWNTGDTTQSITVSSTGSFTVQTVAGGCTSAVSAPINTTFTPNPTITTSGNVSIAPGGSTTLAASGATTYQWSPLIGLTPANGQGASVLASPPATTLYTVTGTTNGCQGQAQVLVTVLPVEPPTQLSAPVISPGTGTYEGTQSITITTNDPGASIYYTTNGNVPRFDVPNSFTKLYIGPIQVVSSTTIRAVSVREGAQNSSISLAVITINNPTVVANPVISPDGGTFDGSATVTITTTTPDATIYYTTNGNVPTLDVPNSFTKLYTGPFTLFGSATVRAVATKTGWKKSDVTVANFTINNPAVVAPVVFSPAPGNYSSPVSVSMSTSTPGATIYYTTNGNVPLLNPFPNSFTKIYSSPVLLNSSRTLRAIAVKSGFQNSVTSVGVYTITNGGVRVSFDEHAEHPFYFEENAITSDKPFSSLVYPNPSDGEYTLFINGQQEGECTVYVYSLLGTLVDKFTFSNTLGQHTISLKSKPSGAYLFRIQSGAFEEKIKVIKK